MHLELCGELALDHVSLEHILAVVEVATVAAFKGPTFQEYKSEIRFQVKSIKIHKLCNMKKTTLILFNLRTINGTYLSPK